MKGTDRQTKPIQPDQRPGDSAESEAGETLGERPLVKERRLGKFRVWGKYVHEAPEQVAFLLASLQFVPYRVEMLAAYDNFEYVGVSPFFEEIDYGHEAVNYDIVITRDMDDVLLTAVPVRCSEPLMKAMGDYENWGEYSVPNHG